MLLEVFPIWLTTVSYIGILASLISSFTVMFSLVKLRHKDFSTEIRKYSTLIDILTSFVLSFGFILSGPLEGCLISFFFMIFIMAHGLWVFYMSLSMYKIICKQKNFTRSDATYPFIFCAITSGLISSISLIASDLNNCQIKISQFELFFVLFAYCLPQIVIFVLMIYYYRKVKQVLTEEIEKCDATSKKKREFFIRIIGFPVIFLIASSTNFLVIFEIFYPGISTYDYIRLIIYAFYPLVNSIFYGLTQSSKRMLRYAFKRNQNFVDEEDLLHELRTANYILPRFYLDLIDQSEEEIFK